jgi:hypothetical protein
MLLCPLELMRLALSTAPCCPPACCPHRGRIHAARGLATSLSAFVVSTALLLRDQASNAPHSLECCMGGLLPKIKALQLGSLGQPGGVGTCVPEHCILLLSLPPVSALQSELNAELGVGVKAAFEAQAADLQTDLQHRWGQPAPCCCRYGLLFASWVLCVEQALLRSHLSAACPPACFFPVPCARFHRLQAAGVGSAAGGACAAGGAQPPPGSRWVCWVPAVALKRRRWAGFLPSAGVQGADFGPPGAPAGATRAEAKAAATAAHWGDPPRAGGLYWATYKVRWQACDWMVQQSVLFAHLPAH